MLRATVAASLTTRSTVMPARTRSLHDLIAAIMAGADTHTGTAPQHDDMTLVLARCV